MSKNIAAATLTYGDRLHFLFQSIDRLLEQKFIHIYVYCNGISLTNYQKLREKYNQSQLFFLYSEENLGSAGGYSELLQHIVQHDNADYILLLDDDNLVPLDCYETISNLTIKHDELYYFHRPDRTLPKIATELKNPEYVLGSPNSFLGRDLFSLIRKEAPSYLGDLAAAPYGGLLLSREALSIGVLPIKELYLYADDYEYTYRLVSQYSFKIIFSEAILIEDLEKSFHLQKGIKLLNNRYSNASDLQLYYSVRNNTWLGLKRNQSKALYMLNIAVFSTIFSLQFIFSLKIKKTKIFIKAVRDGFTLNKTINN